MSEPGWVTETDNFPVRELGALATADVGSLNYQKISGTFQQVRGNTTGTVANALGGIFNGVGNFIQDGLEFIADFAENVITGIAGVINGIISAFTGIFGATGGINQAIGAMTASAETLATTTAAVQSMQNQFAADGNNGINVWLDFTTYANASSIADIAQTAVVGSGAIGISSGAAVLSAGTNPARILGRYSADKTNTDAQLITAVYKVAPTPAGAGGDVNILVARANASMTTYVYAAFSWTGWSIHNVVSGVDTVLTSGTYAQPQFYAGGYYTFQAGFNAGVPTFQLIVNGVGVAPAWKDTGGVTNFGANYRYCGFGLQLAGGAAGGQVAGFGFVDDADASVIGDMFRAIGNSVTAVTIGNNASCVLFPNNFFDTVEIATPNYTWAPATANKLTVSKAGVYIVTITVQWVPNGIATYAYFGLGIFRNGILMHSESDVITSPGALPFFIVHSQTFEVPMKPGDYVQPGLTSLSNSGTALNRIVGGGAAIFNFALANTGNAIAA
jgi:hypothetical protein